MKSFVLILLIHIYFSILPFYVAQAGVIEDLKISNNTLKNVWITPEACQQPIEIGRCFALFQRYSYNVEKNECIPIIYGGCGGNLNNFDTKIECEDKCLKKINTTIM